MFDAGKLNYDGATGRPSSPRNQQERRRMGGTAGERLDRGARSSRLKNASERYSVSFPRPGLVPNTPGSVKGFTAEATPLWLARRGGVLNICALRVPRR